MNTGSLRRTRLDVIAVVGLSAAAAGFLGTVAAANPTIGAAAIGVAVFGGLTLWRPYIGFLVLVGAVPLENVFILGDGVTALKAGGVAVFGLWLLRKLATGESWRRLTTNGYAYAAAAFVLLVFLSLIWASNARAAQRGAFQVAMLLAWSLLVLDLVRSQVRADVLARVLVAGGLVAAALTVQQYFAGAKRAGDMIAGGVNATAVILVSVIPFAFYLFRTTESRLWRVASIVYIGLGPIAVTTTYSRMNLLVLALLLPALLWLTFRDGRHRGWLFLLVVGGSVACAALVPWDSLSRRAETILPYLQRSVQSESTDREGYSGRGYHIRVGFEIVKDNPILGVGYNNYGEYFRTEYQYVVGGVTRVYRSNRSPHSSYVGILADLGSVGLLVWLLVLGLAARKGFQAWALVRHLRGSPQLALVECLLVLFFAHVLAYGWYLPSHQDKLFWLTLGLVAVLPTIASEVVSPDRSSEGGRRAVVDHRRALLPQTR